MTRAYRILAQEIYEPPAPARRRPDPTRPSARTEATLLTSPALGGSWTVAWKTSAMSAPAFSTFARLREAWACYTRHREDVRVQTRPAPLQDRRRDLERQLARLQAELETLS